MSNRPRIWILSNSRAHTSPSKPLYHYTPEDALRLMGNFLFPSSLPPLPDIVASGLCPPSEPCFIQLEPHAAGRVVATPAPGGLRWLRPSHTSSHLLSHQNWTLLQSEPVTEEKSLWLLGKSSCGSLLPEATQRATLCLWTRVEGM